MNLRITMVAMALAVMALAGGCVTSAPQEVIFEDGVYKVQSRSITLRQNVKLVRRNVDVNDNGFLHAQIEAINLGRRDVQFQYRFRWLDDQQMLIPGATAIWKPISLGARSTEYFSSTAPMTECRDFMMEVRFVHDSGRW